MKNILFILFLFPIFLVGQVSNQFNGNINIFASSGTNPNFTIQAFFNNCNSSFAASQAQVSDVVYFMEGASVIRGVITTISNTGSVINATITGNFTVPPTGIGAIVRETPNIKLAPIICGISNDLQAAINNATTLKLDAGTPAIIDGTVQTGKNTVWRDVSTTDSLPKLYDARNKEFVPIAQEERFNTLAAFKASTRKFYVGQKIETAGYFSAGDGGAAKYAIVAALEAGSSVDGDYQFAVPGGLFARMDLSSEQLDKLDTRKFGVFRSQSPSFIAAQCNKARAVCERNAHISGYIVYSGNGKMTLDPIIAVGYGPRRLLNIWFAGEFQFTGMVTMQRCNIMGIGSDIGTQFQYDVVAKFDAPANGNTTFKLVTDGWIRDIVIDGNNSPFGGIMLGDTVLQQGTGYFRGYLENVGVNSYNSGVCLRVNSMFWYWVRDCAFNVSGPANTTVNGKAIDIVADRRSGDGSGRGSFGEFNDLIISGRGIRLRMANNDDPNAIAINPNGVDALTNITFYNIHTESIFEENFILEGTGLKIGITEIFINRPMISDNLYTGPIIKATGPVRKVTVMNYLNGGLVNGFIEELVLPNMAEPIFNYSSPTQALVKTDLVTPSVSQKSLLNWYNKFDGKWSGAGKNLSPFVTKIDTRFFDSGSVPFTQNDSIIASRTTSPYIMTANQTGLDGKPSAVRIVKPQGSTVNVVPLHTQFSFPFAHNSGLIFGGWIKANSTTVVAQSSVGVLRLGKSETVAEFISQDCASSNCVVVTAKDAQLKIPGSDWIFVSAYVSINNPTNDPGVLTFSFGEFNADSIDALLFKPFIGYAPGNLNDYQIRSFAQAAAAQTINLPVGVLDVNQLDIHFDNDSYIKPIPGSNKLDISSINFTPGTSGITATNVEDAIKEVKASVALSAPLNRILYGTGTGVTSSSAGLFNPLTGLTLLPTSIGTGLVIQSNNAPLASIGKVGEAASIEFGAVTSIANFFNDAQVNDGVIRTRNGALLRIGADGPSAVSSTLVVGQGKIGINTGTNSIKGAVDMRASASGDNVMYLQNTSSSGYAAMAYVDNTGTNGAAYGYGNTGVGASLLQGRGYAATNNKDFLISTDNGTNSLAFFQHSTQRIGISRTLPAYKLDVNGSFNVDNNGGSTYLQFLPASNTFTNQIVASGLSNILYNNASFTGFTSTRSSTNEQADLNVNEKRIKLFTTVNATNEVAFEVGRYITLIGVPVYANEAAAAADTNLPTGGVFKVTGETIIRTKN
jgi:hypothetical protein